MIGKYALYKVFAAFRNTEKDLSVRAAAQQAKVGVATSKRCCDYLLSKKILTRQVFGKMYQYSLNDNSFLTKKIKQVFTLAEIEDSDLIQELMKKHHGILSMTLFGSTALGTDTVKSDIDLLIITQRPVKILPLKAEKKINREVAILNYAYAEWKKKAKTDKPFYDRVIVEGVSLYGEIPLVT